MYSAHAKREFVHVVHTHASDADILQLALNCLVAYEFVSQSGETVPTFDAFLSEHETILSDAFGDTAKEIQAVAREFHGVLTGDHQSTNGHVAVSKNPILRAKHTISMWKDLGHMHKDPQVRTLVDSLTYILHEHPDTAKNILESVVARLTVGELATKPLIGLVAVASVSHGLPEWMSTDAGITALLVSTLALAVAKTEQDIDSKLHGKPYLTVESNILSSVLGFELRKSAYFVRLAWLVPTIAGPLIAYLNRGVDISPVLLTQDLLYVGPMIVDALLRHDMLDPLVAAIKRAVKAVQHHGCALEQLP